MINRITGFKTILFPSHYLPIRELVQALKVADAICMDPDTLWKKHSLFNRTWILGANGPISLSVPIEHLNRFNKPVKEIRISYQEEWIRVHKGALFSAYNTSAFFPYFRDELFHIYDKKHRFLFDLNLDILQLLLQKANLNLKFNPSAEDAGMTDLSAYSDLEKIKASFAAATPYPQVFTYKFPFQPYLSVLDKISNTGTL